MPAVLQHFTLPDGALQLYENARMPHDGIARSHELSGPYDNEALNQRLREAKSWLFDRMEKRQCMLFVSITGEES